MSFGHFGRGGVDEFQIAHWKLSMGRVGLFGGAFGALEQC